MTLSALPPTSTNTMPSSGKHEEALQQVTREYHREKFWENAIRDDPLAELSNSQEAGSIGVWVSSIKFGVNEAAKDLNFNDKCDSRFASELLRYTQLACFICSYVLN
ncbi:uncharacterized protein LOC124178077 isoform X2 [Neodiprion fabricii]|uniref:uncharacterized protein LOC124178077 isoform X2 n=1 Tax=Neodiprion fabricii TaxID=2872261 RepID=UPI001ED9619E|nr:uncharacterized protein LOC124178077 isoform X2 [Neodiprion fabricii]